MDKYEQRIFEKFKELCPEFAGEAVSCEPGNEPPDFLCTCGTRRIGVELGEWLNQEQMHASQRRTQMENGYMDAIKSEERPRPRNIGSIWIEPHPERSIVSEDSEEFCRQLYEYIDAVDGKWDELCKRPQGNRPQGNRPQGYIKAEFPEHPLLAEYLKEIHFRVEPCLDLPERRWIYFPEHGGPYCSQPAICALNCALNILMEKKTGNYSDLHEKENLDELYLIAYYSKGFQHNSPYETPDTSFEDIAQLCEDWLQDNHGAFDKVFLFDAINDKVKQVFPRESSN